MTEPLTKELFNRKEYHYRYVPLIYCLCILTWNCMTWIFHIIDWRSLMNQYFSIFTMSSQIAIISITFTLMLHNLKQYHYTKYIEIRKSLLIFFIFETFSLTFNLSITLLSMYDDDEKDKEWFGFLATLLGYIMPILTGISLLFFKSSTDPL